MPASALSPLTTEPWVRGGLVTKASLEQGAKADAALPATGGTMTGAINMGAQKITNLGTPTDNADAVTKSYVDGLAAPQGGLVPWTELRAYNDDTRTGDPHHGGTWEARIGAHTIRGVGACLSTVNKSGNAPDSETYGKNCWCRISSVNGIEILGAWVFGTPNYDSNESCYSYCTTHCSDCLNIGTNNVCSRAALFAAP
jgi:hypothetical protein